MAPSPDQAGRLPRATPNMIAAPGAALLGGLSDVFDPEKGKAFSSLSLLQLGKFSLPVLCWISFIQEGEGEKKKKEKQKVVVCCWVSKSNQPMAGFEQLRELTPSKQRKEGEKKPGCFGVVSHKINLRHFVRVHPQPSTVTQAGAVQRYRQT